VLIRGYIPFMADDTPVKKPKGFQKGKSGNPNGRPKGTGKNQVKINLQPEIQDEDRDYFGYDSKKFLERALLRASTWEEGLKYAKELRMLQHPSLQSVQTKSDTTHTLTLRWSRPDEISSNEKVVEDIEYSVEGGNEEVDDGEEIIEDDKT
jgi:hypothetical protein